MVSVQSQATLAACALFAVISRRVHPRYMILLGSCCFLVLPALLCQNKPVLYLAIYAILLFGRTLVDYAVPAALLYAVPVEIAGTYCDTYIFQQFTLSYGEIVLKQLYNNSHGNLRKFPQTSS